MTYEEQILLFGEEFADKTREFCLLVSGAINCYEDGTIKEMMQESKREVYDLSVRMDALFMLLENERRGLDR